MVLTGILVYATIGSAAMLAAVFKKLTMPAAFTGFIVAVCIFTGSGVWSLLQLALFFVLGTAATRVGHTNKKAIGEAEHPVGRNSAQVLANGGVAAVLGLLCLLFPAKHLLLSIMIGGSLAAAAADTLSSEIGIIYGRRFFNIITFRPDKRGLDGVISIEGLLAGLVGAIFISMVTWVDSYILKQVVCVAVAGFSGTIIDSVLGAVFERRGLIGNNLVNLLNTLFGALIAGILTYLM